MTVSKNLDVLGVPIALGGGAELVQLIGLWARKFESRYVCFANVHSVIEAQSNAAFATALRSASYVAPDGMPIAMAVRLGYGAHQQRVSGPDVMLECVKWAAEHDVGVYALGGSVECLDQLKRQLKVNYPRLNWCGGYSPPYRPLSEAESSVLIDLINSSGAGIIFVGLGCPKQELWMAAHSLRIRAVLLGVGAAFDFHAGLIKRAPLWMRGVGLEWLHRLFSEPRRLFRRYAVTNTIFLAKILPWLRRARRGTAKESMTGRL